MKRTMTTSGWICALAIAIVWHVPSPALAGEPAERDPLEDLSRDVVRKKLFSDSPQTFADPPWAVREKAAPSKKKFANGSSYYVLGAGLLLGNGELGEASRFAGSDGIGMEVRFDLMRPSRWNVSAAFSVVNQDGYSTVDEAPSEIVRYLFGIERSWDLGRALDVSAGAGFAWSAIDIDDDESNRDIEGLGGYVELRLMLPFAKRFRWGLSGRLVRWQGEDGFGNVGDELSTTVATDLGFYF